MLVCRVFAAVTISRYTNGNVTIYRDQALPIDYLLLIFTGKYEATGTLRTKDCRV